MKIYAALLRGVNLGGHKKLPMADFRTMVSELGLKNPKTYIQSGNLVFGSDLKPAELEKLIETAIEERFGFFSRTQVVPASEIRRALDEYPYDREVHTSCHVTFLDAEPSDEAKAEIASNDYAPDNISFGRKMLFLYLPNGVANAKVDFGKLERALKVNSTSRNLRTVGKIADLCESIEQ
ncbi:MAG: DUF1697 domain-containing protein [Pyrinomonadaceae bacterium]